MAGIYIHIPFCKQACHYCNFHFSTSLAQKNDFIAALLKEIRTRADYLEREPVETIYFGGGTPSLLSASEITRILGEIHRCVSVAPDIELTLEVNPDDVNLPALRNWNAAGVNRLSIGIQSFFREDLLWMNRVHNEKQALRAVPDAQSAGLDNISVDLIYGVPGMTDERWKANIDTAVSLKVTHLSCYALTVEPKTALQKKIRTGSIADIIPDDQARQFLEGSSRLEENGYEHYEISNFAQPGKRSRHNSAYWQSKRYLGLGPSAHSFNGHSRQWNVANNALYIQQVNLGETHFDIETLRSADILNEYIMTSLRTSEGLDLAHVARIFGPDRESQLAERSLPYIRSGQMAQERRRLILTRGGRLFADGIAAALFTD